MTTTRWRLLVAKIGIMKTRLLLRIIGFARTIALISAYPAILPDAVEPDPRWPREIAIAARTPLGGTCLDRSVLLWFMMRQRHLDGRIRIGVARNGDTIDGHAWVEWNGEVLNDAPDIADRFAVFDEDPIDLVFR